MTPNSKAKDLIATFRPYAFYSESGNHQKNADNQKESAKKCAVKAVNEVLKGIKLVTGAALTKHDIEQIDFWKNVKEEIKKL